MQSIRLTITELLYFTADGRIDFRELVKDLAAVFKTRIELRQIGVRDVDKDPRRNRHLRQTALLPYVSVRVCTGFDQDGKRAEPVPEPDEDFGCLRTIDVLPEKRAGNL